MKKLTLLTAALLTTASVAVTPLTAQAANAPAYKNFHVNGKQIVVAFPGNCDINSLLEQLKECFPQLAPSLPEMPDNNKPETDKPEVEAPETDKPENNKPENKPENKPDTEAPDATASYAQQVVNLVNAERSKAGLAPLGVAADVQAAAQVRAVEIEASFSHTRPNGSSFATALKEQNVSYKSAGENIAWGQRSPEEVVNAWMNSEGHRANIMNPRFTTIGVGYHQNAAGTKYWSQLFTA